MTNQETRNTESRVPTGRWSNRRGRRRASGSERIKAGSPSRTGSFRFETRSLPALTRCFAFSVAHPMRSILLSTLSFLLFAAFAASVSAQSVSLSTSTSSSTGGNGWGKGGKPKPTPTPTPAPFKDPIWTGANSSSWTDPNNWNPAGVPTSTSDVTFSGTPPNFPDQPSGTTTLHTISFSADAASFTGLNTSGEIFALQDSVTFTAFTHASSNLQTINQLDVYFASITANLNETINLSGTGGLTLSEGLRWGGGGLTTQRLVIQGPGPLIVNGTFEGGLNGSGAIGTQAHTIVLNGDATSGQTVTFNPTSGATWSRVNDITLGGRVTLNIANAAAVDAGTVTFASGANNSSLLVTGVTSGSTFSRNIGFAAASITGGTQTIGVSGVSAIFSGAISTAGTNNTVALSATATNTATFSGVISGARPITITGGGTVIVTVANTYTGTTAVNAGTLFMNGSLAAGSAVTVNNSGSVLGGTGTFNGSVSLASSGTILEAGTGSTGQTLTIKGALTQSTTDSIIELALGPTLIHSTLTLTSAGPSSFYSTQKFTFIDLGATTGTYDNIITGVTSDPGTGSWTITNSGYVGTFSYDSLNQTIDLNLSAVPEPSTWAAAALAFGVVGYSQRRRFTRLLKERKSSCRYWLSVNCYWEDTNNGITNNY